jgi:hypothetical protein
MKRLSKLVAGMAAAGAMIGGTSAFGQADVIVGDITGPSFYGTVSGKTGFAIGTTSCNIGTVNLDWFQSGTRHPVIAQNIYIIDDDRIMQIGASWLKHGFCALQQGLCGSCTPAGGGCASRLGVGCSDPYSSSLNGSQGGLGPRSEVNAYTGAYLWPYGSQGQSGNAIFKRVQVDNDWLNPSLYPNAIYVGEGHYVAADDAAAGNGENNASYEMMQRGSASSGTWRLQFSSSTQREIPAIFAWRDYGTGGVVDPTVNIEDVRFPNEGLFHVASKPRENGDGTWRYSYAVQNINSHLSGGSFSIPVPAGVNVTNVGFNDIDYHSGEPYDNTDWAGVRTTDAVSWSSPETFEDNANSNALRWSTMYTFWFDADTGPTDASATLTAFRDSSISVDAAVTAPEAATGCVADYNGDGSATIFDVVAFITDWNGAGVDFNGDGTVNIVDVVAFITEWNNGCP